MMFSESPPNLNQMNVMRIDRGIATSMISVPRMFRRKSMMMIIARSAPRPASRCSPEIVCLMYSDWSKESVILTFGGTPVSFGIALMTLSTTSIVFALASFCTRIVTPGLPSIRTSSVCS